MTLRLAIERFLDRLPPRAVAMLALTVVIGGGTWALSDDGFARASRVKRLEIRELEKDLIDTTILLCQGGGRYLADRQTRLMYEFFSLTGTNWVIPSCPNLGVRGQ